MKKNKKMAQDSQNIINTETVDTTVENKDIDASDVTVDETSHLNGKAVKSVAEKEDKPQNNDKSDKKKNAKNAKKSDKKSFGQKVKSVFGELKKVSWPSFGTVVKQTSVVIVIVALCTLVLFGIDSLFSLLYKLLTKGV